MLKRTLCTILVIALLLCVLCACDLKNAGKPEAQEGEKSITIVIGDVPFSVKTDAEYLHNVLVEMNDKNEIKYEYSSGPYGVVVSKVNELETTSDWIKWISIYHSIDDITLRADIGEYPMDKYSYENKEYFPSSVGVEYLPIYDGSMYLLIQA